MIPVKGCGCWRCREVLARRWSLARAAVSGAVILAVGVVTGLLLAGALR